MWSRIKRLLPKKKYGEITIYSSGVLTYGDTQTKHKMRAHSIARRLSSLEDMMQVYARANTPAYAPLTLQQLTATWDIDKDELLVIGTGIKRFAWRGTLDQFFTTQLLALTKQLEEAVKDSNETTE